MVRWTNSAKKDLQQIYDYIALDSELYAGIITREIANQTELLNIFPKIGKVVAEINNSNIREIIVCLYRLIYEISTDKITIIAAVHSRRKLNLNIKYNVRQKSSSRKQRRKSSKD